MKPPFDGVHIKMANRRKVKPPINEPENGFRQLFHLKFCSIIKKPNNKYKMVLQEENKSKNPLALLSNGL